MGVSCKENKEQYRRERAREPIAFHHSCGCILAKRMQLTDTVLDKSRGVYRELRMPPACRRPGEASGRIDQEVEVGTDQQQAWCTEAKEVTGR